MLTRSSFINKTNMKKVDKVLRQLGYGGYPGDDTSNGRNGSGYVMNLLNYFEPSDREAQRKIMNAIQNCL